MARSRHRRTAFVTIGSIAFLCMILGVVWMGKRLSTPMAAEELKNEAKAAVKEAEKAAEEAGKAAEGAAPAAATPAGDMDVLCNKALDHIISLLEKDPSVPPEAKAMMKTQASDPAKRADSISKCKQDKPETVECMLRASDMAGMMACQAEK